MDARETFSSQRCISATGTVHWRKGDVGVQSKFVEIAAVTVTGSILWEI